MMTTSVHPTTAPPDAVPAPSPTLAAGCRDGEGRSSGVLVDPRLVEAVRAVSVPRRRAADSFVLHAPLELLARVGLLAHLAEDRRDEAIDRIVALGSAFEASGAPVDGSFPVEASDLRTAAGRLDGAIRAGDLAAVDAWTEWLSTRADHDDLTALLGESIVDSLAAAGHAPIGLHLMSRVAHGVRWGGLLRQPLRELARHPDRRLTWFRPAAGARGEAAAAAEAGALGVDALGDAVRAVPHVGLPGSNFIHPVMGQVEASGIARDLLLPVLDLATTDHVAATRVLLRAASWSMCRDDEAEAPYGWSHCLTMPQGVMSLAGRGVEPRTALAVAATFVAGFRAANGRAVLPRLGDSDPPAVDPVGSTDPADLAEAASFHHDAHLVKYTLACLHAAEDDPAWASVHLAAAAFLVDWWRRHPAA